MPPQHGIHVIKPSNFSYTFSFTNRSIQLNLLNSCHAPRSCAMLDWFMEGCMILSDWPLGGRGGIWLPTPQKRKVVNDKNCTPQNPGCKSIKYQNDKQLQETGMLATAKKNKGKIRHINPAKWHRWFTSHPAHLTAPFTSYRHFKANKQDCTTSITT